MKLHRPKPPRLSSETTRMILRLINRANSQFEIYATRDYLESIFSGQYIPSSICNAINYKQERLDNPRHN